ncbi:hypothetical protein B0H19DRAFT_1062239 [Mycena capillaripes]|nr:hypothetical protein B0H19DRAFT_1062239 [Mycena capillaripes]
MGTEWTHYFRQDIVLLVPLGLGALVAYCGCNVAWMTLSRLAFGGHERAKHSIQRMWILTCSGWSITANVKLACVPSLCRHRGLKTLTRSANFSGRRSDPCATPMIPPFKIHRVLYGQAVGLHKTRGRVSNGLGSGIRASCQILPISVAESSRIDTDDEGIDRGGIVA